MINELTCAWIEIKMRDGNLENLYSNTGTLPVNSVTNRLDVRVHIKGLELCRSNRVTDTNIQAGLTELWNHQDRTGLSSPAAS